MKRMNTIILLSTVIPEKAVNPEGYVFGVFIAVLILAYLIYSLVKPEKF
jgi:K+-transporting ATPase KdpF subunit